MNEETKEKSDLQWHPAFYAGIQIEFAEEAHDLTFENEQQLGTKPKEIDVLIIKKNPQVSIRKNIGRIFRKHNIIEYKSPDDYLSVDDFYKVYGYACFYKSDTQTVNSIKAKEITISYVTKRYPRKVIRHLEKEQHLQVKKQSAGIYYVYGDRFPIQFLVTSQLPKTENFWLHYLTNDLKTVEDAENLLKAYKNFQNDSLHQSLMDIIVEANKEIFMEARKMCRALYELMEDEIREREKRAEEIGEQRREQRGEERGEKRGGEKMLLSLVKDGLLSSTEAAKRLFITEEEFEQKLSTM